MIDALKKISSPSVANAIETFNVRPRNQGNMSSEIRTLFTELGPLVGYAVTAVIRAEPQPLEGHRASTFGWWDYVLSIPAPRVIVVHDLDEPRGQGAQWGEVQANIHKALGCLGVVTNGSIRDIPMIAPGFQMLAGSLSPSHAYTHVEDFGIPVTVHGMKVNSGDLIHADQHGAVVVPLEIIPKMKAALDDLNAREARIIKAAKEVGTVEAIKAALKG